MKKIARICWNSNGWTQPSGRLGKSTNKESYEFLNGYGHEEWLLDTTKLIDGYHYGYLQAIGKHRDKYLNEVFDVSLYSINNDTKQRWWLGEIQNLEVVSETESKKVYKIYKSNGWYAEMQQQLMQVGANTDEFKNFVTPDIFAVVKFKPSDLNLLEEPAEFRADDPAVTSNYYNLKSKKLDPDLNLEYGFSFKSGHNIGRANTKRSYRDHGKEVSLLHNQLQTELYDQLVKVHGYDNVGTEVPCGHGNRVDIVVLDSHKYTFYEIKTSRTAKSCIREALGQLMEYAYYSNVHQVEKLVVVSPHSLFDDDQQYIDQLNKRFNLSLHYLQVKMSSRT